VSTSTVSKVINRRDGVSKATGRRVQEAVDLLRFTPSMAATSLRGGSTQVVGLFAARLGPWESEVLRGATGAAGAAGYGLLAWVGPRAPQSATSIVEGAILLADSTPAGLAPRPLVLVSSHGPTPSRQCDLQSLAPLDGPALTPFDIGSGAVRCLLALLSRSAGRDVAQV
jgi:LacI family transcriptional regulator